MNAEQAVAAAMPRDEHTRSGYVWESVGPSSIHAHLTRPIVVHLDRFGARSVLDLGCGNGWFTSALSRCGFDAMGADISESGVDIANHAHPDVPFRRYDAMQPVPPDLRGRFDAVVAVEMLDHVAHPREVVRHAMAALRPGGLLIVTTPYHGYFKNLALALSGRFDVRWQTLREHGRVKFYSPQTLTELVADCGLRELHFETIGRVPLIARSMLVSGKTLGPVDAAG